MKKPEKPLTAWQEAQRKYKLKYFIKEWNKPKMIRGIDTLQSLIGATKYTDVLLVASILQDDKGRPTSILIRDSISGLPGKDVLEFVRDQINHLLDHKLYNREEEAGDS